MDNAPYALGVAWLVVALLALLVLAKLAKDFTGYVVDSLHVMRREAAVSAADARQWDRQSADETREVIATALAAIAGAVRELRPPAAIAHTHTIDPKTLASVHSMVKEAIKLASVGTLTPRPARGMGGSPDLEAEAQHAVQEQTVAAGAADIFAKYRALGQAVSIEQCVREARSMLNGAFSD